VICSEESVISGVLFKLNKKMARESMMNQLVFILMFLQGKVSLEVFFGMKASISTLLVNGQGSFALTV